MRRMFALMLSCACGLSGLSLMPGPQGTIAPARAAEASPGLRVMILPFRNLTRVPEDDWLGDSFAESLTMGLLKVEALQLIERGQIGAVLKEQAFGQSAYVDESSAPRIGKMLGAKVVILGSYQKVGDQLQANVRFVDVETGAIDARRSAQIQGSFNEIFELQKKLATSLVTQLNVPAGPAELAGMDSVLKATDSTEAYKLYIAGRQQLRLGGSLNLDKAKESFRRALSIDPKYVLAIAGLAEVHTRKARDLDQLRVAPPDAMMGVRGPDDAGLARRYADEALAINPELPEVLRALAWVEQLEGDSDKALELISKAIRLHPDDSDSLIAYVNFSFSSGAALDAARLRQELTSLGANLEDPWVQFSLGALGVSQEASKPEPRFEWPRALLESAQAKLPDYPYIPMTLMGIAQQEGKPAEAEKHFQRAYALGQDSSELLASLATVRQGQGRNADALDLAGRAVKLNPDSRFASLTYASVLYALGRKDEAEARYAQAEGLDPENPFIFFSRGITYFVYGQDFGRAEQVFEKALELIQKRPAGMLRSGVLQFLGMSEFALEKYDEARPRFEELRKDPLFYGPAYEMLARISSLQSDHAGALEAFTAYLTIQPDVARSEQVQQQYRWYYLLDQNSQNPQNVAVLNDLGQIAQLRKTPELAEKYWQQALALEPANPVVLYNLGSFYLQSGKSAQALPLLEQAVTTRPDYLKAWYNLGLTRQSLGDKPGARAAMQKVLSLEPAHEGAAKALQAP